MPFHRCAICLADGSVVAHEVDVSIDEVNRNGVNEWFGTITVTHLASLAAGQRYVLKLDDGRTGEFLVRRNTFAGGINRAVAIQGLGALR
ncbi:MAG TPA: hypothetical protein VJ816_05245 [Gemmatimonadales bacterium]|nr:hypothetical protein [Gemmatimonadales bacterium]